MRLSSISIGRRLGAAFALVVFMALASAGLALHELSRIQARLDEVVNVNNVKATLNSRMADANHAVARMLRTLVLVHDEAGMRQREEGMAKARAQYDEAWAALQRLPASEEGQVLRARIAQARDVARGLNDRVVALARAGQRDEAVALLLAQAGPAVQTLQNEIASNVRLQEVATRRDYEDATAAYAAARHTLLGSALALLLAAGTLAWWITRSITRPLQQACDAALAVAHGDLTRPLQADGHDETARLLHALQSMQAQLSRMVRMVRLDAEGVATAAAEIAQGNHDLSQRTEEQASALEQTAASMSQLAASVRGNAQGAHQAAERAREAADNAGRGGEEVLNLVDTMKSLDTSAARMGEIIGTIDGIAFQTNILSLNAAVEAARAGEAGRGFAVVAAEVRALAQRSGEAAREIRQLIQDSVMRVADGVALADRAGHTMRGVVAEIRGVTGLVEQISQASLEQSTGVTQVGEAVGQLDQVTQQNAALVEQSAAAAESLTAQAQRLVHAVAAFRLADADAAAAPRPAPVLAVPTAQRPGGRLALAAPAKPVAAVPAAHADWTTF